MAKPPTTTPSPDATSGRDDLYGRFMQTTTDYIRQMWKAVGILGEATSELTARWWHDFANIGEWTTKQRNAYIKAWVDSYKDQLTKQSIEEWVDYDAVHHDPEKDKETSPGGRFYDHTKRKMQKLLDDMPELLRDYTKKLLMTDPTIQGMMRDAAMAKQFGRIDPIIREVYERKYPEKAKQLRWHGKLYDKEFNHKFLTETSHDDSHPDGKIVAMEVDEIVKLFAKRAPAGALKGDHFPHIIITTSHAQGETEDDVRSITHGIEAMARDSEGTQLPHAYIDKPPIKPGKTLTLYACDVGKTPWKNGAALLRRLNELKRIAETGQPDRAFHEVSPGAKRIAKLILKCMAEKPELIDVESKDSIAVAAANNKEPITLREDAVEIAHHFQLIGYSKGGNVVSDAMRYLVSELTSKRADGKTDIFVKHEESPTRNGDCSMSEHNVRNVVRSIAVMALASVEVGMDDNCKRHGVRRVAINNEHDLISAHLNYQGSVNDERWMIKGTKEYNGHAPQHFMGTRRLSEEFAERGYALDDHRVARRLKEFFAPNYLKAAVGRVRFNHGLPNDSVIIEAATGTTDAQILQFERTIREAVRATTHMHSSNILLTSNKADPGIFTLMCKGADFKHDRKILGELRQAFLKMRETVKGLVISQTITDEKEKDGDIASQIAAAPKVWKAPDAPVVRGPAMITGRGPKVNKHGPARITGNRVEEPLENNGVGEGGRGVNQFLSFL